MTSTTWGLLVLVLIAVVLLAVRNKTRDRANGGQILERTTNPSQAKIVSAKIIRKDISSPSARTQPVVYDSPTQNCPQGARIFGTLTIRMDGGKEQKFHVSEKDFCKVTEGDHGKLTYQGDHFIHFELEEKEEA